MAGRPGPEREVRTTSTQPAATSATRAGPRVGIALGSGSARGWAHIGVLRALTDAGIEPEVVAGTSIGALVGAAYVTGRLEALETWVRTIRRLDIVRLMDLTAGRGGFIAGARVFEQLRDGEPDRSIERLDKTFAAVATDLETGREIWLRDGSLLEAIRASVSVPGLFTPHRYRGRWLVDGGLVNPVPVSLCRALGAEVVIAVDLSGDVRDRGRAARGRRAPQPEASGDGSGGADETVERAAGPDVGAEAASGLPARVRAVLEGRASFLALFGQEAERAGRDRPPGFFEVLATSVNIMQDRITRSRLAGDPPDAVVTPRLGYIRLLDFDHAAEAIAVGRAATEEVLPAIGRVLGRSV